MLKFVISSRAGETGIEELAAATAQRAGAVRYGLLWFHQTGRLHVEIRKDGSVSVAPRPLPAVPAESLESLIRNILLETAAFRTGWLR